MYSAAGDSSLAALYFVYIRVRDRNVLIMKTIANIIVSHVAFLAFFGGVAFAFAQEETSTLTPPPNEVLKENVIMTEVTNNFPIDTAVKNPERTGQLSQRAQDRIINLAANISNRIDAVITRLQNIADRIASRITKLGDSDVDTITAASALASAQISLDAAKAAMLIIDTEVVTAVGSADVRMAWQSVTSIYTTARNHLGTAHTEIRAAAEALQTTRVSAPEIIQDMTETADSEPTFIIE